jgi:hypothetical protein
VHVTILLLLLLLLCIGEEMKWSRHGIIFKVRIYTRRLISLIFVAYLTTLSVLRLYSVDDRMVNEYGAVGGLKVGRGNRITRRKAALLPLCPPQIAHYLIWN